MPHAASRAFRVMRKWTGFKRPTLYRECKSGDTIVPPYLPPSTDPIHSRTSVRTADLQGPVVLSPRDVCFWVPVCFSQNVRSLWVFLWFEKEVLVVKVINHALVLGHEKHRNQNTRYNEMLCIIVFWRQVYFLASVFCVPPYRCGVEGRGCRGGRTHLHS